MLLNPLLSICAVLISSLLLLGCNKNIEYQAIGLTAANFSTSNDTPTPTGISPTPTPSGVTPTPTPNGVTPTPTPNGVTPTPTPNGVTPTPTPNGVTPTPTPSGGTPTPTPNGVTPTPTPNGVTPTPTPNGVTPTPTPSGVTPTPTPSVPTSACTHTTIRSLTQFRSCRDALYNRAATGPTDCRYQLTQTDAALLEGRFATTAVKAVPPVESSPCASFLLLLTRDEFDAVQEERFKLTVRYSRTDNQNRADLIRSLTHLHNDENTSFPEIKPQGTYRRTYLDAPVLSTPLVKPSCNPVGPYASTNGGPILYWNYPKNWFRLAHLALTFYYAHKIVERDPWRQPLANTLKADFFETVDYIITHANATDFDGLTTVTSLVSGQPVPVMGWNNLETNWDAFDNGTCTPPTKPNLYSSSWSLWAIATAYSVTKESKYLEAFQRGSVYFHQTKTNPFFNGNYEDYQGVQSTLGGGRVMLMYTVGAGESEMPPERQSIRYHYTSGDPGRYATNTAASMALAMSTMGVAYTDGAYYIQSRSGTPLVRSWANIGLYAQLPNYQGAQMRNMTYYDRLDYKRDTLISAYTDTNMFMLARSGIVTHKREWVTEARDMTLARLAGYRATGNVPVHGTVACALRAESPVLFEYCRDVATLPLGVPTSITLLGIVIH